AAGPRGEAAGCSPASRPEEPTCPGRPWPGRPRPGSPAASTPAPARGLWCPDPAPAGGLSPVPRARHGSGLRSPLVQTTTGNGRPAQPVWWDSPHQPRKTCVCPTSATCRPGQRPPLPGDRLGSRPRTVHRTPAAASDDLPLQLLKIEVLRHYLELARDLTTIS